MSLMSTYRRLPVSFTRGQGMFLYDQHETAYLDAISGIAVCGLGHSHRAIQQAICDQAGQLLHTSNLYAIEKQQQLADRLVGLSQMDQVFFGNSGAEANEAAIKLARLYAHRKGIKQPAIVVTNHSFHGRTLATLSATGNQQIQDGFAPLLKGFIHVPYNDIDAIVRLSDNHHIVAILVEPIQGEGGIIVPDPNYLTQLRALCDQQHWLLMLDEVQTGMGRTGQWFACQNQAVVPDVLTVAKALGNGVPIGACLAKGQAAQVFTPGTHGSTFGGNPLSCAAALAVIQTIESENLMNNATIQGNNLMAQLKAKLASLPGVVDIRGQGLMIGIELDRDCATLTHKALERHLLINVTSDRCIRLLPPLIIQTQQVKQIGDIMSDLLSQWLKA